LKKLPSVRASGEQEKQHSEWQTVVLLAFLCGPLIAIAGRMSHLRRHDLAHAELTDRILAGFFETYRELGQGFSEPVLCRALAIVLRAAGLSVLEEAQLDVWFRGQCIGRFRADLIVNRRS
jgi:hypothetical protein